MKHKKILINQVNGFKLFMEGDFYQVVSPSGFTMVNTSGTKEEVIDEIKRWKKEIDINNQFMLDVENGFIKALSAGK